MLRFYSGHALPLSQETFFYHYFSDPLAAHFVDLIHLPRTNEDPVACFLDILSWSPKSCARPTPIGLEGDPVHEPHLQDSLSRTLPRSFPHLLILFSSLTPMRNVGRLTCDRSIGPSRLVRARSRKRRWETLYVVFDCTRWNANPDDGLNERELWLERPVGRVLGMP
ncbi:hypothetical protein BOTBODRAFT_473928 [Botryobasidium botryosum FD-172 SS1]|uniref:Uncharacterized protein n=1 Tax=Botryobasidium botryosum (strain FD-172 SS1) TaxID=930990 RepID=A0A067M4W9_BOTB1|nr:hypothetical protein BOTBODRAFT_473928 [Botryobasidium botryosum FD-172 SS1]